MKGWIDRYYQNGLDFKPKSISANGNKVSARDATYVPPIIPIDRNIVSQELSTKDLRKYFPLDRRSGFLNKIRELANYDAWDATDNFEDNSKAVVFGEDNPKLGYLRNASMTEDTKRDVLKYAKKRGLDPNILLSTLAIEHPNLKANKYANTHDIGVKMLEKVGIPVTDKITLTDLAKNAKAYTKEGKINYKQLDKKIEEWFPHINRVDSVLNSLTSPIDAHALFLSEFGLDSVNPAQQALPGVKESYSQMVKKGADYIKSRKIFNNGGQLQTLENMTNFTNYNKPSDWLAKYE